MIILCFFALITLMMMIYGLVAGTTALAAAGAGAVVNTISTNNITKATVESPEAIEEYNAKMFEQYLKTIRYKTETYTGVYKWAEENKEYINEHMNT